MASLQEVREEINELISLFEAQAEVTPEEENEIYARVVAVGAQILLGIWDSLQQIADGVQEATK